MPDFALDPLPPSIRPLSNAESDRLKAKYPGLSSSPDRDCLTCGGKGEFTWYAPGSRTETGTYACNCADQWVLHRVLLSANIQVAYQRLGWADLTGVPESALTAVLDYMDGADAFVRAGVGLILHGTHGTGKTTLSSLVLRNLISRGYDGYFTTFSEMIDTYTGAWNDKDEKTWFHRRVKNAGVLVLDDVGREYQGRKSSGLPESTFDEVLRHRVSSGKPTLITTNKTLDALAEGYGSGVMSLLRECAIEYGFRGDDFRDTQLSRHVTEIRSGLTRPVVIG